MFELYNVAIVPLIVGIVQLLKIYGLPAKFSPLAAILIGLVFGVFLLADNIKEGIIIGLMFGLSASGLYSGGKNLMENGNRDSK
ncbi:hypothetical protein MHB50_09665 [Siminovitchia sp. FSL H7-0308]|uniref:hypothetical protein n=1 Tax=Siminovitchia sp. FSL H7-0308 TaxID=2921432 RepID=UPI0030EC02C7